MKSNRIKLCREKGCRDAQTAEGYCRYHYMKNWKTIVKEKKLAQEKKDKFIAVLAEKYSEDVTIDDVRDEIIGRNTAGENLSEIGIKEGDLKKESDGGLLGNLDLDELIENMKYDDKY